MQAAASPRKQRQTSPKDSLSSQFCIGAKVRRYFAQENLANRVAQARTPVIAQDHQDGRIWRLNNAADCAQSVTRCPIRYVLSDDLTRLCADLAYSRGARTLDCADLLRVPATTLWLEWCNEPWQDALRRFGLPIVRGDGGGAGRRGALVNASADGRRGLVRTFWSAEEPASEPIASSVEAYFDFDTEPGASPAPPDGREDPRIVRVRDHERADHEDVLARCFRFRYEDSWADYYGYHQSSGMTALETDAIWHHALGTVALDIPLLLAFVLLLATRSGLPQRICNLERLNRIRTRTGKVPLLDHIDVRVPLLPEYVTQPHQDTLGKRRSPRLHHVRGHLARRGSHLYWRVPHLRGSARAGKIQTRTVVWTIQ
jgi:hypothetical protein